EQWDDYGLDESEGVLRLGENAFGKTNGLTKSCLFGMRLEPHLVHIRRLAHIATYKAVESEQNGKLVEGLEIRLALVRCAKLMREQQRSKMPLLVSLPIAHIATIRPKGEPLPEAVGRQERGKLIQARFISYLKQIRQSEKAKWVQAELKAGQKLRDELQKRVQKSPLLEQLAFV
ncbi:MAG: hypothetical protein N3B10_15745, partial [Armatimonadetes bacterium]|nr:hypothetical protein [Armatimonadota bacterium]